MAMATVNGVKVMEQHGDVKVISITDWLEAIYGENRWSVSWKQTGEDLRKWLEENNAHYFGVPKEDFFIWKAVDEAEEASKKVVIVENMS